jgi:hypothetical protein
MFDIKKDESFDPTLSSLRPTGARKALYIALYKMEVGEYFVVDNSIFPSVSVRARVSEAKKMWGNGRQFRCHTEPNGTKVIRIA